jgi:hypothetical protein
MYIYKDLNEYIKLYRGKQDKVLEDHLCSLWINEKSVVLVNDIRKGAANYRPDFSKSIVYFDEGEEAFEKYEDKFEPVIEVKYDQKRNMIDFIGPKYTKSFACARYFGDKIEGHIRGYMLYDDSRPRLNLIMERLNV